MSTSTLSGLSVAVAAAAPVVAPALALRFLASRAAKMSLFLIYASARVRSSEAGRPARYATMPAKASNCTSGWRVFVEGEKMGQIGELRSRSGDK